MTTTTNGNGNIVEKIRKLLRLARDNGATEAEAGTAMAMAQKLMMQHNIDHVEDVVEQHAVRGDWKNYEVDKKWQQTLGSAIAHLYSCRFIMVKQTGQVQFVGKASNVLVAFDTLEWVTEQINAYHKQALQAFREDNGNKLSKFQYRDFRLTFKEAAALRVWHRISDIVAKARNEIPAHMALVVIDQALAAADDILKDIGTRTMRATKMRRSGYGTGAGRAAGDKVKLQHTVKEEETASAFAGLKPSEQKRLVKFYAEEFNVAEDQAIVELRQCSKADLALHLEAATVGYM
jgi:hypothetical protein